MMRFLEHHAFHAMGTSCGVGVTTMLAELPTAHRAIAAAVAEVSACELALSRFDADERALAPERRRRSLDGRRPPAPRGAGSSLGARDETGGRFDPAVLPALVAAGYDRSFEGSSRGPPGPRSGGVREPPSRSITPAAALGSSPARRSTSAASERASTADRAVRGDDRRLARRCRAASSTSAAISPSGASRRIGGTWRIAVTDPRHGGSRLSVLSLSAGGVATSGRDRRRFGLDGELHHLIDPATGEPAVPGPLAVTVVGPDAASAEAHATALAITPVAESSRYVAARPHIAALVVPAAGAPFIVGDLPTGVPAWAEDVAS